MDNTEPPDPLEALPNPPMQPKPFPWRLFWLLALMMLLASLMLLPYALALVQGSNPQAAERAAATRITTIFATLLQAILLYWPVALLGLWIARRLALGAPYLEALVQGGTTPTPWTRILRPAAWIGFGSGVLVLLLSVLLSPLLSSELTRLNANTQSTLPNAWEGFLASISAGINEEILLRLFLLSLLAWAIQWLITRRTRGRPSIKVLWIANVLAAVAFGLLHTPNLLA